MFRGLGNKCEYNTGYAQCVQLGRNWVGMDIMCTRHPVKYNPVKYNPVKYNPVKYPVLSNDTQYICVAALRCFFPAKNGYAIMHMHK